MGKEVYFHFSSLKRAGNQPDTSIAWETSCMKLSSCELVSDM